MQDFFGAKLDDTRVTSPFDFNVLICIHKLNILTKSFTSFRRLYFDFDGFHFYIYIFEILFEDMREDSFAYSVNHRVSS